MVDFRSWDLVGNVENFKRVKFTVRAPDGAAASPVPQAPSTTAPHAVRGAGGRRHERLRTLSALRGGRFKVNVSCQGVSRGTLTLTVDRATRAS